MGNSVSWDQYPISLPSYETFFNNSTGHCNSLVTFGFEYGEDYELTTLDLHESDNYWLLENECYGLKVLNCSYDNLIWPNDVSNCTCPSCGCDVDGSTDYFTATIFDCELCYQCDCDSTTGYSCGEADDYTNCGLDSEKCSTVFANSSFYSSFFSSSSSSSWDCRNPNDNSTMDEGDIYFDDYDCASPCVCQSDGTFACATGYNEIYNDETVYEAYIDYCGSYLAGCENDISQWTNKSTSTCSSGSSYYECPRCECNYTTEGGSENGYFYSYKPYTSDYSECLYCECRYSNTLDCNDYDGDGIDIDQWSDIGDSICPPTLMCGFGEFTADTDENLWCSDYTASNKCGRLEWQDIGIFDSSFTIVDDARMTCWPDWQCDTFSANDNTCVYADLSFSGYEYNCENGNTEEITIETPYYFSCCDSGNLCNNETIDTTACTYNDKLDTFYTTLSECYVSETWATGDLGNSLWCGGPALDFDEYCEDYISMYFGGCMCEAISTLYDDVSTSYQSAIQAEYLNSGSFLYAVLYGLLLWGDIPMCDFSSGDICWLLNGDCCDSSTFYSTYSDYCDEYSTSSSSSSSSSSGANGNDSAGNMIKMEMFNNITIYLTFLTVLAIMWLTQ